MSRGINQKQMLAIATSFLVSSFATASFAAPTQSASTSTPASNGVSEHQGIHHGSWHHGHHRCAMMSQLNLSEQQKTQMKAVHQKFRNENKAEFETLRSKHEQLKALGDDPANAAKKEALRKEIREEHHTLMEKHHKMMDGILTPEQMEKMKMLKGQCHHAHSGTPTNQNHQRHSSTQPSLPSKQ